MEDAYAAGIVDADGSIVIGRQNGSYQLHVQVSMKTPSQVPTLMYLQYGGNYGEYKNNQGANAIGDKESMMARWVVNGNEAQQFLSLIRPYMIEKANQADVALTFPVKIKGQNRTSGDKIIQEYCFDLIKTLRSGGKGRGQGRR